MELNKYDSINSLHTSTYDWKCRVRVQSFWQAMNRETKEIWGINMILLDESNYRVHGYVSAKYSAEVVKEIEEGGIYIISNFKVKEFLGDETYRPVRTAKHIYFTPKSKFIKDSGEGLKIDQYAFDLFKMQDLEKLSEDNRFLIDVVGFVENFQPHYTGPKTAGEKSKVKFDLSDGRYTVNVTLFDTFGIDFEDAIYNLKMSKIYVILAAARLSKYDGKVNLSNYPATRIYINPDHFSVKRLKLSVHTLELMEVGSLEEEEDPIPLLSVKEIKLLRGVQRQPKVSCQVTVRKVDDKVCWYYAKCTGCAAELQKQGAIYKCVHCNRLIPYPDKRFRLCTICSDKTASIAIIFPNSEICRIIDKTVFDVETDAILENAEDIFPDILKQFERKNWTITVELTKDNLLNGSTVYEAVKIGDGMELTGTFDPAETENKEMEEVVTMNASRPGNDPVHSPPTGNSSTKSRARNIEAIHFNQPEHSPAKPLKTMKKEKD